MIGREIISAVSQLNEFDIISQRFCRKSKKLGVSWHWRHLKKSWSKLHWIALWLVVASIACVQLNVCSVLKTEKQKQCRHCIWECSNSLGRCFFFEVWARALLCCRWISRERSINLPPKTFPPVLISHLGNQSLPRSKMPLGKCRSDNDFCKISRVSPRCFHHFLSSKINPSVTKKNKQSNQPQSTLSM